MTLFLRLSAWKNLIKRSFSPRNQIITISKFNIHTSEYSFHGEYEMQDPKSEADM